MSEAGKTADMLLREMSALRHRVLELEAGREGPSAPARSSEVERALADLRAAERRHQALVAALPESMLRVAADGTVLEYVPSPEVDLPARSGPGGGNRIEEVLPVAVAAVCMENISTALRTGVPQTCECRWSGNGNTRDFEARIVACGEQEVVAILRDVTSRKAAEGLLQEAEHRYRLLFNQSPDAIVVVDPDTMLPIDFNDVALRLLGYTRDEFARIPFSQHEIQESPEEIKAHIERIVRNGVDEFDTKLRTKDGRTREVLADVQAIELSGRVVFHSVLHDITERKIAEERLRRSESHLRLALRSARVGTWEWDIATNEVVWSEGVEGIFGLEDGAFAGSYEAYLKLIHPEDRSAVEESIAGALQREEPYTVEHRILCPDGSVRWLEGDGRVIRDESGRAFAMAGTVMDITQRKLAETRARPLDNELAHVARVSTMGEMAAGLAHELNQPLTVISGYARTCADRIRRKRVSGKELLAPLEAIGQEADRAGEIIRRLWNLISKGETRRSPVDVNELLREIAAFMESECRQNDVTLRLESGPSLPPILADGIQIQQVVLNLARNACEAMARSRTGRRLTVRSSLAGPESVLVSVEDEGPGIPPEVIEHIFEPFYSTKEDGLGMGLTISRSIIDAHGGHLSARNNAGGGATFEFTVPVA